MGTGHNTCELKIQDVNELFEKNIQYQKYR